MTGIEICLIIIGIACVCASFFVSRKTALQEVSDSHGGSHPSAEIWTEKDEQIVKQRLEEILQEQQEEYIDEAKDRMGQICNEKIMAVDEFTKQILEKINSNHQEVVFMYNMLNEKQKELKTVMTETVKPVSNQMQQEEKPAPVKKNASVVHAEKAVRTENLTPEVDPSIFQPAPTQAGVLTGLAQVKKSKKVTGASQNTTKQKKNDVAMQQSDVEDNLQTSEVSGNVNLQIQKMYKAGKSVLDISKELDIGQGEVKLVIALYEGRKG